MKKISAEEFDEKFENGEDVSEYLDFSNTKKIDDFEKETVKTKKVNVDFPENILFQLDKEAKRVGVTRQSIIKIWIAERLKAEQSQKFVS